MNTKKIMKEFMTLGYSGQGVRTERLEDVVIGNYIILRVSLSVERRYYGKGTTKRQIKLKG